MRNTETRKTALIIDSDPRVRDMVAVILSKAGHLIQVAKHHQVATRIVDDQGPDLVLMDASTPGFWINQFNERLLSKNPLACLILMIRPEARMPSSLLGNRFLHKPFRAMDLMRVIGTCKN